MWGSSWTVAAAAGTIGVVLLAALLTAWTPIFAILIILAAVPLAVGLVLLRRAGRKQRETSPEEIWAEGHHEGPVHDVNVGGGLISDRERANPQ